MLSQEQIGAAIRCLNSISWAATETKLLDQLFRETANNFTARSIAAKVAFLDLAYGVGMWQRSNAKRGINLTLHNYKPKPKLVIKCYPTEVRAIYNRLTKTGLAEQELADLKDKKLKILHQHHQRLTLLDGEKEPVLASKYLHFCFPKLFPIMDSVILKQLNLPTTIQGDTYLSILKWHRENLSEKWTWQIRVWHGDEWGTMTPVRALDLVLWIVGLAEKARRNKPINKEVQLFLKANPSVARELRSWPE